MQISRYLNSLNFALAGAREGFGPFLGVYLQQQGFNPAVTGFAMALAGAAGLVATTPLGALIDRTERKRTALAVAVAGIAAGALLLVVTKSLTVISLAQAIIGVADTALAPLIAALTLGLVGQRAFGATLARNEAYNHAGNALNALIAAVLGYWFGLGYVSIAILVMAVTTIGVVYQLDPAKIDHTVARGGEANGLSTWHVLVRSRPLMLLTVTVLLYQTANGALMPFMAQAMTKAGNNPSLTTGVLTVISQLTMVGFALFSTKLANRIGYRMVMTVALTAVIVRGALAAVEQSWWFAVPVQMLEGISMGLAAVAMPVLVARVMEETGHSNAGLGSVMTAFGAGATLSPLLAGMIAQHSNFPAAFAALAGVGGLGLLLWLPAMRMFDR